MPEHLTEPQGFTDSDGARWQLEVIMGEDCDRDGCDVPAVYEATCELEDGALASRVLCPEHLAEWSGLDPEEML